MIIDGRKIAAEILNQLHAEVEALPFTPKLIDVLVGDDPVTESYVRIKSKRASEIGIGFEAVRFPADISEDALEAEIQKLNLTENLCGMIVQLPLPEHLDKQRIIDRINPQIDVDVITSTCSKKFYAGEEGLMPPTAAAIMEILKSVEPDLRNKKVLVIGAGDLVGKPAAFLLKQAGASVLVADKFTENINELGLASEIIVSGAGVANLVGPQTASKNSIVIDAGTAESSGGIAGDADFNALKDRVRAISPVPGGVGPVTVAMLLKNVVSVAKGLK